MSPAGKVCKAAKGQGHEWLNELLQYGVVREIQKQRDLETIE